MANPTIDEVQSDSQEFIDSRFVMRVFYVFAALAAASILISVAGKTIGASIAMDGHSDDPAHREIVIGNNVLSVPANVIRFEKARQPGEAHRLDLYFRWPSLDGYSQPARDDFNNRDGRRNIVFVSIEPRMMSRDMSGRLEPIYRRLVEPTPTPGPAGLQAYRFSEAAGYANEELMVGPASTGETYVARCLTGQAAAESLAGCERDVHFADGLSLTYRFPARFLGDWKALDDAIRKRVAGFIQAAR